MLDPHFKNQFQNALQENSIKQCHETCGIALFGLESNRIDSTRLELTRHSVSNTGRIKIREIV